MRPTEKGLAQSVRQRLLNRARESGEDYNLLLSRYAIERLLYRLSKSPHADRFVLKGAMLFTVWTGELHRPTRDLDLLGFGEPSEDRLIGVFREICNQTVDDDGMQFDAETISASPIRDENAYAGIRMRIPAALGNAQLNVQVDVGFGDVVTPSAVTTCYPTLLDQPAPQLRMYTPESVIAEKLEAIVSLGLPNSRMKDFYDLWVLLRKFTLEDAAIARAIHETFERRGTPIPSEVPLGLTAEFARDPAKEKQWTAFLRRSGLDETPPLHPVIDALRERLLPLLAYPAK